MAKQLSKNERRDQIVQAAAKCFSRSGYHLTTMDDIAVEAGVSKGTLYNYYKDKQQLFLGILGWFSQPFEAALHQALEAPQPAQEKLMALVDMMVMMSESPELEELSNLTLDFYAQTRFDDEVTSTLLGFLDEYIKLMEAIVQQGIDSGEFRAVNPREIALMISAMIDGLGLYQMLKMPDFSLSNQARQFIVLLIRAISI